MEQQHPTIYKTQMDAIMPLFREQLASGHSVRFAPRGISMLPMLREGVDSVVISPLPEKLKKYDIPLYQRENGKYVLHRIVRATETYTCMGDNQFQPEPGLNRGQMIAVVTGFYRGDTFYSIRSPKYWLYCRLWHYSRPVRHFWRRGIAWLKRHLS